MSMKLRLKEVIETWIIAESEDGDFPIAGDELAYIMAEAAIAVLHGIVDAQEFMRNEDMLKD